MATHTASYAFAPVECVTRPQLENVPITELAPALGVPARVDRSERPIARLSPLLPEFGLSGFSLDQVMLGEALLTYVENCRADSGDRALTHSPI